MILDEIITEKRKEITRVKEAKRSLTARLARPGLSLIAEIKKASPSKGLIKKDFKPQKQAKSYQQAGASAISVLTDKKFFQGSNQLLKEVREVTDLPVLRKDFIIDSSQIYQSFFLGADVILLIVAALKPTELEEFLAIAAELELEAIVEIHNLEELAIALEAEARIIGINNRDLKTFQVDLKTTETMVREIEARGQREGLFIIAESGVKSKEDCDYLQEIGVDGVLIGESIMRAESPAAKIAELGFKRGEADEGTDKGSD